jgi:hypothetical protein
MKLYIIKPFIQFYPFEGFKILGFLILHWGPSPPDQNTLRVLELLQDNTQSTLPQQKQV